VVIYTSSRGRQPVVPSQWSALSCPGSEAPMVNVIAGMIRSSQEIVVESSPGQIGALLDIRRRRGFRYMLSDTSRLLI